jgi:hypothetical protein
MARIYIMPRTIFSEGMQMNLEGRVARADPPHGRQDEIAVIEEEISYLEERLAQMGFGGDCAYERALEGFYSGLLDDRRAQLASLERVSNRKSG